MAGMPIEGIYPMTPMNMKQALTPAKFTSMNHLVSIFSVR